MWTSDKNFGRLDLGQNLVSWYRFDEISRVWIKTGESSLKEIKMKIGDRVFIKQRCQAHDRKGRVSYIEQNQKGTITQICPLHSYWVHLDNSFEHEFSNYILSPLEENFKIGDEVESTREFTTTTSKFGHNFPIKKGQKGIIVGIGNDNLIEVQIGFLQDNSIIMDGYKFHHSFLKKVNSIQVERKDCSYDMTDLLRYGCKCGAMEKERV